MPPTVLPSWSGWGITFPMNCRKKIIPFPPLRHFGIFERHSRSNGASREPQAILLIASADLEYVRRLGADGVVEYKSGRFEEWVSGMDVVLETVGGDIRQRSLGVLKPVGTRCSPLQRFQTPLGQSKQPTRSPVRLARVCGNLLLGRRPRLWPTDRPLRWTTNRAYLCSRSSHGQCLTM